jgi:hypothetical protein
VIRNTSTVLTCEKTMFQFTALQLIKLSLKTFLFTTQFKIKRRIVKVGMANLCRTTYFVCIYVPKPVCVCACVRACNYLCMQTLPQVYCFLSSTYIHSDSVKYLNSDVYLAICITFVALVSFVSTDQ